MGRIENQRKWIKSEKGQAYLSSKNFKESLHKYNRTTRKLRDKRYRDKIQGKIREVKLTKGCKKCGFDLHHTALEFHHRIPSEKKFRLADSRNYSWKSVLAEMEKCDVLCANCHAILEYEKRVHGVLG